LEPDLHHDFELLLPFDELLLDELLLEELLLEDPLLLPPPPENFNIRR
jgi:hypothetical protein